MNFSVLALLLFLLPLLQPQTVQANEPTAPQTAPYLLPGSPTFNLTITQFREKFNAANPDRMLNEFRAVAVTGDRTPVTRAATKINENLYASTGLERGTLKIKSMHITWLPVSGPNKKVARLRAEAWMAALMRFFTPGLSEKQSRDRLTGLLTRGKQKRYYAETEGAIRYVVADNGENGLTFAVEPIKLTLSGSPE